MATARDVRLWVVMTGLLLMIVSAEPVIASHNAGFCNTVNGTNSSETVSGTAACEDLFAKDGNDVVNSGGGEDDAHGENGIDTVRGEGARDYTYGGPGNDNLHGGEGDLDTQLDTSGGGDSDKLCGGAGSDNFEATDGDTFDHIYIATGEGWTCCEADTFHWNTNCPFSFRLLPPSTNGRVIA